MKKLLQTWRVSNAWLFFPRGFVGSATPSGEVKLGADHDTAAHD
jgi:hypothetical protein